MAQGYGACGWVLMTVAEELSSELPAAAPWTVSIKNCLQILDFFPATPYSWVMKVSQLKQQLENLHPDEDVCVVLVHRDQFMDSSEMYLEPEQWSDACSAYEQGENILCTTACMFEHMLFHAMNAMKKAVK